MVSLSSQIELRRSPRYQLEAQARFWCASDGWCQEREGTTRDISACGVFIVADVQPAVGSGLHVKITLPRTDGLGVGARLEGEGKVVRVESDDPIDGGFAASVQLYPNGSE